RAIVRNGSFRFCANWRNSSTVRLRGWRLRLVAPRTVTSSIGFRCVGTSPRHMAGRSRRFYDFECRPESIGIAVESRAIRKLCSDRVPGTQEIQDVRVLLLPPLSRAVDFL